jgi:hypothetical protein
MKRKQASLFSLWLGRIVLAGAVLAGEAMLTAGELKTANVMAPLVVDDWGKFQQELDLAKMIGVDGVSTDVWWGAVEAGGDQQFDWSYYDRLSDAIIDAGLKWVPILSFHQCGGNVGDDCDVPLPAWIWGHFDVPAHELQYLSEQRNRCKEVVSLWADHLVIDQYRQFMEAFEDHFHDKAEHIIEINVSCGAAGELRYPSYNSHDDGAGYPTRGALQCYGRLAREDFRAFALNRYGDLNGINQAWGTLLTEIEQVNPPDNPHHFFHSLDYLNHPYGKDLTDWQNRALVEHGKRMLGAAIETFDESMAEIELGIKIPGVHWLVGAAHLPRAAEVAAGLVTTKLDLNSDSTAHGYAPLIGTVAAFAGQPRRIVLHFTCLEMGNNDHPPAHSRAEDLVFWVAQGARDQGVPIKGENALSGGVERHEGWERIENAFTWSTYEGLTVLRISEVTSKSLGRERYRRLIQDLRPVSPPRAGSPSWRSRSPAVPPPAAVKESPKGPELQPGRSRAQWSCGTTLCPRSRRCRGRRARLRCR